MPTPTLEQLEKLSDEDLAEWIAIQNKLAELDAPRARLQPKQETAEQLSEQSDELLYGGAAGGGKTEWLLFHCIAQCTEHAGNRVVIFRRVFPSLVRSIIPRAKALLRDKARFNELRHEFTFPNGSVLELATLQYSDTVLDYQGAEYGCVAFEEITEFLEAQVTFMLSRLRAPAAGIRPHMIATTNPGGVGHKWVKRRYVQPAIEDYDGAAPEPLQVWRPRPSPDSPTPLSRCFVPATLADNPALLERDPDYRSRIRMISKRGLRKALETGDWDAIDAVEGALWDGTLIDAGRVFKLPTTTMRSLAIDPSDGDETGDGFGISVQSLGVDSHGYVEHSDEWHMAPIDMAKGTIELYRDLQCGRVTIEKNHGGKWIPALLHRLDPTLNIKTVHAAEGKVTRAEPIAALFDEREGIGRLAHMFGHHPELEDELTTFTGKPGEPSPDRLDAMVWGLTDLMLEKAKPTLRYRAA